jgi:hypothetical protein
LWGFLKDSAYRNNPHTVEELKGEITSAVDSITDDVRNDIGCTVIT